MLIFGNVYVCFHFKRGGNAGPPYTCTLCNKFYIGESGRKLGDRFREHLLDVKNKG